MFEQFFLADKLGVPVHTVRSMPLSDYYGHLAFYEIRRKAEEKQDKKTNRKMRQKPSKAEVF